MIFYDFMSYLGIYTAHPSNDKDDINDNDSQNSLK